MHTVHAWAASSEREREELTVYGGISHPSGEHKLAGEGFLSLSLIATQKSGLHGSWSGATARTELNVCLCEQDGAVQRLKGGSFLSGLKDTLFPVDTW